MERVRRCRNYECENRDTNMEAVCDGTVDLIVPDCHRDVGRDCVSRRDSP